MPGHRYKSPFRSHPEFGPGDVDTAVAEDLPDPGPIGEAPDVAGPVEFEVDLTAPDRLRGQVPQQEQGSLREVAQDLKQLRRALNQPGSGGRTGIDPSMSPSSYMRRLRNQITVDRDPERGDPDEEPAETEFGAYLRDAAYVIETQTDRLTDYAQSEWNNLTSPNIEVVCCIINALYELVIDEDDVREDTLSDVRAVAEDDIQAWTDLLIELLVLYRDTINSTSAAGVSSDGSLTFSLIMMSKDISTIILEAIEAVLSGLMFAAAAEFSDWANRIDRKVTEALRETRCAPLMRIWTAIYNYVFGTKDGLLMQTQQFLRDTLTRQSKKRRRTLPLFTIGFDESLQERTQKVNDLITILRAISDATDVLDTCRVPEQPRDTGRTPREIIDDEIVDPVEDEIEDDIIDPIEDEIEDEIPDRDDSRPIWDFINDPTTSEAAASNPFTGASRAVDDPDVGPVRELESERDDLLYLTPTNAAKMMVQEFGADPSEALSLARERDCQDELAAETEQALTEVGIINNQE